jgi:hypothetical protein
MAAVYLAGGRPDESKEGENRDAQAQPKIRNRVQDGRGGVLASLYERKMTEHQADDFILCSRKMGVDCGVPAARNPAEYPLFGW